MLMNIDSNRLCHAMTLNKTPFGRIPKVLSRLSIMCVDCLGKQKGVRVY